MLLYTMLYIVLAYLMLFAALTNSVCLNNASFFFLLKYFLCQGYELSGEIALKNNHYYYYYYRLFSFDSSFVLSSIPNDVRCAPSLSSFGSRLKTCLFRSTYKDRTLSLITVHMCMV